LFWSLSGIAFYLALQSIPQTAKFFSKGHIVDFTARQWLQTIFINPIPYQLWFVRDLMVLIILSPLLYQGIKHYWRLLLALAFIGWILVPDVWQNSSEALLFFIVGASLSVHQPQRIENNYARFSIIWMFFWMLLVLLKTALQFANVPQELIFGIFKLSVLVGVFACWSFYDRLFRDTQNTNKALLKLSAFTFFIYASHEPVLTVFKKVLFVILGET
jgi:surface polysaccharide O-acyltransferase-like enzyme